MDLHWNRGIQYRGPILGIVPRKVSALPNSWCFCGSDQISGLSCTYWPLCRRYMHLRMNRASWTCSIDWSIPRSRSEKSSSGYLAPDDVAALAWSLLVAAQLYKGPITTYQTKKSTAIGCCFARCEGLMWISGRLLISIAAVAYNGLCQSGMSP